VRGAMKSPVSPSRARAGEEAIIVNLRRGFAPRLRHVKTADCRHAIPRCPQRMQGFG
jgi:hypothetical protein